MEQNPHSSADGKQMKEVRNRLARAIDKAEKILDKRLVPISMLLCSVILYFLNPFADQSIGAWDGVVGRALISGVSVQRRIGNFNSLLIFIPILFLTVWLFCSLLMRKNEGSIGFSGKYAVVLAVPVINAYVNRYRGAMDTVTDNIFVVSALYFCLILTGLSALDSGRKLGEREYTFSYLCYLNLILSVRIFGTAKLQWGVEGITALIVFGVYAVALAADRRGKVSLDFWGAILSCLQWIPFLVCCVLEFLYILNARGIYIKNYRGIVYGVLSAAVLLQVIAMVFRNKRCDTQDRLNALRRWQDINVNWGSVLGLGALLSYTDYYVISNYADNYSMLFEIGNGSASVDTFLRGKLPILDYFSGHAIADVFSRIPFMFANGEREAATASVTILANLALCIIFYLLARTLFDSHTALILLFTYPLLINGFIWSNVSMVAVLATIYLIRRRTKGAYYIWWIALAVGVAMQYDRGTALGIGCVVAVFLLSLVKEAKLSFKRLFISGTVVAAALLGFCTLWWICEGISPLFRIREWLSLSLGSSSTWALETGMLGSSATFAFAYTYFFVPALAMLLILYSAIKLYRYGRKNQMGGARGAGLQEIALLIAFSVSVLLFLPRELTYHTLYNGYGTTGVILNYVPWLAICAVSVFSKEKGMSELARYGLMLSVLGAVLLNHISNITKETPQASATLLCAADATAERIELCDDMSALWGTRRVQYSEETQQLIAPLKSVFDVLLEDDETFCDFANATGLYAYLDRVRPCYAAQTPSLLTDEFSQDCYLEELSRYSVPLALLGNGPGYMENMNDIELNVRYWKIAEYIYEKYRPFIQIGDFAVWCEKNRFDEFNSILMRHPELSEEYDFIDFGYDSGKYVVDDEGNKSFEINQFGYHSYHVNLLPSIMAQHGSYVLEDSGIDVLAETDRLYRIKCDMGLERKAGCFLRFTLTRTEKTNRNSAVRLSDSTQDGILFQYNFFISADELVSDNLIRISQDYFWEAFEIDQIEFLLDNDVKISNVEILVLSGE